jgi:hypothetical protein
MCFLAMIIPEEILSIRHFESEIRKTHVKSIVDQVNITDFSPFI